MAQTYQDLASRHVRNERGGHDYLGSKLGSSDLVERAGEQTGRRHSLAYEHLRSPVSTCHHESNNMTRLMQKILLIQENRDHTGLMLTNRIARCGQYRHTGLD